MYSITFSLLILYFALYSILGWICETIWSSAGSRKFVNRGFLSGPWCPIYGFGALIILSLTVSLPKNMLLVFLVSMISASVLEYMTGWLMEALFQTRWWDYSKRTLNIRGRVCLLNSVLFGIMGVVLTLYVHPVAENLISIISPKTQRVVSSLISVIFVMDLAKTLNSIAALKERMQSMREVLQELEQYQKEYIWFDKTDPAGSINRLRDICEKNDSSTEVNLILQKIDAVKAHKGSGRIMNAFPNMHPRNLKVEAETLREELHRKYSGYNQKISGHRREFKVRLKEVYHGITFSRMVWVFIIGSILGYVIETIFCFVRLGIIESRQGLIYGPFSQIYGFGAVIMVLLLTPFSRRGNVLLFFGGAVVGGLFETLCSIIQEAFFGSVSWDYSAQPFSFFGGRTCLLYMLFWGILALFYMRSVYPHMVIIINRIERRPKNFFYYAFIILLSADMLLSIAAVNRWYDRSSDIPAQNRVEIWLDENYPDEMLEEVYPNMKFVDNYVR